MARVARIVAPDFPHHITQRGNRQMDIFFSDDDRERYLHWLDEYSVRHDMKIWAYCLMTNHVHLIVVPSSTECMARALRGAHTRYALYINKKYGWTGHLWQNRYYSCVLDERHLFAAVKYVELNPVWAKMVDFAEDFPWSSAPYHINWAGENTDTEATAVSDVRRKILSYDLPLLAEVKNWQSWLGEGVKTTEIDTIRRSTKTGRTTGDEIFVARLEQKLSREVRRGKPGRKRKNKNE